jgi:hypothetical protein
LALSINLAIAVSEPSHEGVVWVAVLDLPQDVCLARRDGPSVGCPLLQHGGQQPAVVQQDVPGDDQDGGGQALGELEHSHSPGRELGNCPNPGVDARVPVGNSGRNVRAAVAGEQDNGCRGRDGGADLGEDQFQQRRSAHLGHGFLPVRSGLPHAGAQSSAEHDD